jgi:hypothetical protein
MPYSGSTTSVTPATLSLQSCTVARTNLHDVAAGPCQRRKTRQSHARLRRSAVARPDQAQRSAGRPAGCPGLAERPGARPDRSHPAPGMRRPRPNLCRLQRRGAATVARPECQSVAMPGRSGLIGARRIAGSLFKPTSPGRRSIWSAACIRECASARQFARDRSGCRHRQGAASPRTGDRRAECGQARPL